MLISEAQFAMLSIQLSALGQTNLMANDPDMLQTLEFLLEQALKNVRAARKPREFVNAQEQIEDEDGNTRPMTSDERQSWDERQN